MRQNIIVVDDFYNNPEEVGNFALSAGFPDPGDDYTYPEETQKVLTILKKFIESLRILPRNH